MIFVPGRGALSSIGSFLHVNRGFRLASVLVPWNMMPVVFEHMERAASRLNSRLNSLSALGAIYQLCLDWLQDGCRNSPRDLL